MDLERRCTRWDKFRRESIVIPRRRNSLTKPISLTQRGADFGALVFFVVTSCKNVFDQLMLNRLCEHQSINRAQIELILDVASSSDLPSVSSVVSSANSFTNPPTDEAKSLMNMRKRRGDKQPHWGHPSATGCFLEYSRPHLTTRWRSAKIDLNARGDVFFVIDLKVRGYDVKCYW